MSVASASESAESFEMGRAISRAFGAVLRNAALFLGLAFILQGIPEIAGGAWQAFSGTIDANGAPSVIARVIGGLLSFLGSMVLQVAVTRATVSDLAGERPDFTACLKAGIAMILPMIGLTIYSGLGIGLASILLVVPGIILYVAWSVAVPCYVQERVGISASLERSGALTKGARWKIFALLLVFWIVALLLQSPAEMLATAAHVPAYVEVLFSPVVNVVTSMVLATLQATIYVELRDVKEGVLPKDLEVIFA